MSPVRQPEETRLKILEAALELFHQRTFTGTSINEIVELAGITKGALFHHFKGKNELGYAVVDELISRFIHESWIAPLANSKDPAVDLLIILKGFADQAKEDPLNMVSGCPLNNLSQEMSSRDEGFRMRLQEIYFSWTAAVEKSFRAGIAAGNIRADADPAALATTFVALVEGCIGTMKVYRSISHISQLAIGIGHFLQNLKP